MKVLMSVPCLGPGQLITITDEKDPAPEKGEVVWTEEEIEILSGSIELVEPPDVQETVREMWIQYMDAVKRMYPGAKLVSVEPLKVEHPELTLEMLKRIPWKELPRR